MSSRSAPKGIDRDQVPLAVGAPCACGCGRRLPYVDPRIARTGRPQRYVDAACRQRAHIAKREREAREAAERAAEARRDRAEAELREAQDVLRDDPDVADWCRIARSVLPYGATITPELVRSVRRATVELRAGKIGGPSDPAAMVVPSPRYVY